MRRIIVITNSYPNKQDIYNGVYVERHVLYHRSKGLDVHVIAPNDRRKDKFHVALKYSRMLIEVLVSMTTRKFDLVHAHWPFPSGVFAWMLSFVTRKPFIVTSHGSFVDDFSRHSRIVKAITRFVFSKADRIIAVSNHHKGNLVSITNVPHSKVRVIGMGIAIPETPTKEEARAMLGIQEEIRLIIFVGNIEKSKGLEVLVRAMNEVDKMRFQIKLLIGGQGLERLNIENEINSLRLGEYIRFIGPIPPDEVPKWLSAADICVVPSWRESFGLVALEAMASGTPVIASDVGGLSENIVDGSNGLLFPAGDHLSLARKIELLLVNDELSEKLIVNGRKRAIHFDNKTSASEVLDLYDELLNRS